MLLNGAEKQQDERKKKMQKPQSSHNVNPSTVYPVEVPIDFPRQISSVNDQQLPKGDVRPKKNKSQEQISQVMIVSAVRNRGQRLVLSENGQQDHTERKCGQNLPNEHDDRKHGRVPMRFSGHD